MVFEIALRKVGGFAVKIRFLDPDGLNHRDENPQVSRVDLIQGEITGPAGKPDADRNPTTRIIGRFGPDDWQRQGEHQVIRHTLSNLTTPVYIRVRGTNTDQLEPQPDLPTDNPWHDLWFYSNPVFITPKGVINTSIE